MANKADNDAYVHYERKTLPGLVGTNEHNLATLLGYTYLWMVLGLLVTFSAAIAVYQYKPLQDFVFNTKGVFIGLIIAELMVIYTFSKFVKTCRPATAFFLYFFYAALTGLTFSVIFLVYELPSIIEILACTTFAFAGLSIYGLVTKRSLNAIGNFCLTGLLGLVGVGVIFILFPASLSDTASMSWSAVGVIVFSGLIAYDTQKIKETLVKAPYLNSQSVGTINAALILYLDFVNLFLDLLRLLASRK